MRLAQHHILVTGGSRGIGAATVAKCVTEGANVTFIDLLPDEGRALARRLGPSRPFRAGDVTKADQIAAAVTQARRNSAP